MYCEVKKRKIRLRKDMIGNNDHLICTDGKLQVEYQFYEPNKPDDDAFRIIRKDLKTGTTSEFNINYYETVEELKKFLNSNIKGPVTWSPFPIEPKIKPVRPEEFKIVMEITEFQFEILNSGDLRISSALAEVDVELRTYTGKPIKMISQIDIPASVLPNLKSFLNNTTWARPNSEEIVENGLEIIREKVEKCDASVLDYIRFVSTEIAAGLDLQEDYEKANEEINYLVEMFKKNCDCIYKE